MRAPRLAGVPGRRERTYAAIVVGSQSLVLLFGAAAALGLAHDRAQGWRYLGLGCALALACLVCAALVRRPWGVTLGWVLQLATLAWSFVVPAMAVVALVFLALWVTALVKGRALDERDARLG